MFRRIKIIIFILMLSIVAAINDLFIRPGLQMYDRQLRCMDHLLSGIAVPLYIYLFNNDIKISSIAYIIACFVWESSQCFKRGYFQLNQFMFDLIGVGTFILINYINSKLNVEIKNNICR